MRSGDPRLAVVMITHNRRADLLGSLARIMHLPERPRVFLVDNGSTDGTTAAVAERFRQVEAISAGANIGAAARTLEVRHVDTPYGALSDDDRWWEPGALGRAADLLDSHPRLAVVTARVLVGPEEREDPVCEHLLRSPVPRQAGMPGPPVLGFLAGASMVRSSAFLRRAGLRAASSSAARKSCWPWTWRGAAGGCATSTSWSFTATPRRTATALADAGTCSATRSGVPGCAGRSAGPCAGRCAWPRPARGTPCGFAASAPP
jgi:hypothetical protein